MWTKTTDYGDYRDKVQSHKTNTLRHKSIITQARVLGCGDKHIGSKPISRLLAAIKMKHARRLIEDSTRGSVES